MSFTEKKNPRSPIRSPSIRTRKIYSSSSTGAKSLTVPTTSVGRPTAPTSRHGSSTAGRTASAARTRSRSRSHDFLRRGWPPKSRPSSIPLNMSDSRRADVSCVWCRVIPIGRRVWDGFCSVLCCSALRFSAPSKRQARRN